MLCSIDCVSVLPFYLIDPATWTFGAGTCSREIDNYFATSHIKYAAIDNVKHLHPNRIGQEFHLLEEIKKQTIFMRLQPLAN